MTAALDHLVDWDLAERTAARLSGAGPQVSASEAASVVAELRASSVAAVGPVRAVTGMEAPAPQGALVVDRPTWQRTNIASFRGLLGPVAEAAVSRRGRPVPAGVSVVGSRLTGAELGTVLGFLSSRVLGQFDPFNGANRLLLVAPNIVHVERELAVVPSDFRLWVCLHEETHRVQFGATGWLDDHLIGEIQSLLTELMGQPGQLAERVAGVLKDLPGIVRGHGGNGLLDALQTPEQRDRLAGITAVMSLLEGHADVVMDDVGPQIVPTVADIRARFGRRRAGRGAVDQLLRRLLGLDAKLRQYADGARFVRAVVAQVGMPGFNAVWTSADTLPKAAEIADPQAWVRRIHG
jgi:coenzyme F420 biosynthesis associated uncharacterized protein